MFEAYTKTAITFIFESTVGELSARQNSRQSYLILSPLLGLLWQKKIVGGWVNGNKKELPFRSFWNCFNIYLFWPLSFLVV